MTLFDVAILLVTSVLAGAINAIAGGGSFLTFPALVFTGVPDVEANATNSVALWPGAIASAGGYRRELATQPTVVVILSIVSLIGGLLGALLLLWFRDQQEAFRLLVPWLLLGATLIFAFGSHITNALRQHIELTETSLAALIGVSVLQFFIAIYGGFFGGGMGVLMLAAFALLGQENIHIMNALKSLLGVFIKGIAVVAFVFSGVVFWPEAILMITGAIVGGYAGAHYGRQFDSAQVKRWVIVASFVITAVFFWRTYV